jgi:hypothetical protein
MTELFNPIQWFTTYKDDTDTDIPVGNLHEHHVGYPQVQVLLDTVAPNSDVIINENLSNNGEIKIHQFKFDDDALTSGTSGYSGVSGYSSITVDYLLQDALDNYLTSSIVFPSTLDENIYERIGYNEVRSLTALFSQATLLTTINICATSVRSKQYVVEIQTNGIWKSVLYMIANNQTRDSYKYTFETPLSVTAVRIKYKGDYYTTSEKNATITVSAYDNYTGVDKFRVSHYPDFSDATGFSGYSGTSGYSGGWRDLEEGISTYTLDLVNYDTMWTIQNASAVAPLNFIASINDDIIAFSTQYCYLLSSTGNLDVKKDVNPDGAGDITSICIHDDKIYIGTENGKLYSSVDGKIYASINTSIIGTKPITALTSYSSNLYIGTDQRTAIDLAAKLYILNGDTITLTKTFTQPIISSLAVAKGSIYVGLSGSANLRLGVIYRFNGTMWELSTSTSTDGVNVLTYSDVNNSLWAGCTQGTVKTATFDTKNNPTWGATLFYANDSASFTGILSDPVIDLPTTDDPPTNNYVWMCSNTGLVTYIDSMRLIDKATPVTSITDTNVLHDIYFETVPYPEDDITNQIVNMVYCNNEIYGAGIDGNIYKLDLSIIGTKTRTIYVQLQDNAGNVSSIPNSAIPTYGETFTYDDIIVDFETDVDGNRISNGQIYQINTTDKTVVATFEPDIPGVISAPNRQLKSEGYYISNPLYVVNLTQWEELNLLYIFPATSETDNDDPDGLDYGMSIDLYVKTADTQEALALQSWGLPLSESAINQLGGDGGTGPGGAVIQFPISTLQGRWMQFYVVMTTASKSKTPTIQNIILTYQANGASYFFTTMFNTAHQVGGYYNYVRNGDFETSASQWTAAENLTISTSTTGAIEGNRSGKLTWTSLEVFANDKVTTNFTIDEKYENKTFVVSFDYIASTNYVNGVLELSLLQDVTALIDGDVILKEYAATNGISHYSQTFTVPNDISTELILQFMLTEDFVDAFDITIDNVYVGPAYTEITDAPKFRRGILTSNTSIKTGAVYYGYTSDDNAGTTFDFSKYKPIVPNTLFELDTPSDKIRFGALLITVDGRSPTILYDFAVQLDAEDSDMRFHESPNIY